MMCPRCKERMKVTHSYRVPGGHTQRLECTCGTVATVESIITAVNPKYGEGAAARAQRLRQQEKREEDQSATASGSSGSAAMSSSGSG